MKKIGDIVERIYPIELEIKDTADTAKSASYLDYNEADLIQELLRKKDKKFAISFNFTFRNIDNVFSLNNTTFGDHVERIYPIELEIKDTTDTATSASYLDLHQEIDNEGFLKTKLRQKR